MKAAIEPTLRQACAAAKEPFLWQVPEHLHAKLAKEYGVKGRPFLLSTDGTMSGVYPAEARWLICWDAPNLRDWIKRHLAPLVSPTDFMEVKWAAIPKKKGVLRFFHSGDLGDIIACLPAIRQMGGGELILGPNPEVPTRVQMNPSHFALIEPLLSKQPYLKSVKFGHQRDNVDHDFSVFRDIGWQTGESLAHWQARYLGIDKLDDSPWLKVKPSKTATGKLVINRTARYHGHAFPWGAVLMRNPDALFIGTEAEHALMSKLSTAALEYLPTLDLLRAADVIAGCKVFAGNQSVACWIALGLGVPVIQETCQGEHNVMLPSRRNARYVATHADGVSLLNGSWPEGVC